MLGTEISAQQFRELLARTKRSPTWLELDDGEVRAHYNKSGFLVRHRLAEHPMFQLDELFALCRRAPQLAKHRFGVVPVDAHFNSSLGDYRRDLTLDDAIDHLVEKRAYIAIYNAEKDPRYTPVIEGLLGELGIAVQGIERTFNWYSTYVFITANDSITPYHMDREMNFLLQIRGTKSVKLWDPNDDEVMTAEQRDYLFTFAEDSRPTYRESLEAKAQTFALVPGLGVHHPFIAPHLVTTGPELSISFAITFRTPSSDLRSDVHAFNHRARRFGLDRIPISERGKAAVIRTLRRAKSVLRR
jgi:hypothetical protein